MSGNSFSQGNPFGGMRGPGAHGRANINAPNTVQQHFANLIRDLYGPPQYDADGNPIFLTNFHSQHDATGGAAQGAAQGAAAAGGSTPVLGGPGPVPGGGANPAATASAAIGALGGVKAFPKWYIDWYNSQGLNGGRDAQVPGLL